MSIFASDKQRKAVMARITSRGGDILSGRRLGISWTRRTGNPRSRWAVRGLAAREEVLRSSAAARTGLSEAEHELRLIRSREKREAQARHLTRVALAKALGITVGAGAGIATIGGAAYLGMSPQAQVWLGKRLVGMKHALPVRSVKSGLRTMGNAYRQGRKAMARRAGDAAARLVRTGEEQLIGPKTLGAYTARPIRGVDIETGHGAHQVQEWLRDQFSSKGYRIPTYFDAKGRLLVQKGELPDPKLDRYLALVKRGVAPAVARRKAGLVIRKRAGTTAKWARKRYALVTQGPGSPDAELGIPPTLIDQADATWKRALNTPLVRPSEWLAFKLNLRQVPPQKVYLLGEKINEWGAFAKSDRVAKLKAAELKQEVEWLGRKATESTPRVVVATPPRRPVTRRGRATVQQGYRRWASRGTQEAVPKTTEVQAKRLRQTKGWLPPELKKKDTGLSPLVVGGGVRKSDIEVYHELVRKGVEPGEAWRQAYDQVHGAAPSLRSPQRIRAVTRKRKKARKR